MNSCLLSSQPFHKVGTVTIIPLHEDTEGPNDVSADCTGQSWGSNLPLGSATALKHILILPSTIRQPELFPSVEDELFPQLEFKLCLFVCFVLCEYFKANIP